ncbi:hypothetical protein NC797_05860 [Aquibacillus sp. 3ASR75-11]|uniref:Dynein-related subfamily AAA family protein n=1 Tax=Terrihalobacillus insolitus TaxID=2950438 RepID=A0A9X3WSH5_9BACI|nr:hypothetical protein [Terrihalobacillus insolitus]MDC3415135.1 hypothetical protein [Terrihalobacillus insolitus]MDC3424033.1 hypothetical protein [Terrihalobacillus insolitus]
MRLKHRLNSEVERKLSDAVFVGRLVKEDELSLTIMDEPVRYKDEFQDDIQFYIKCLSPIPDEVSAQFYYPNKIFTGSTQSKNNLKKFNDYIKYDRLPHFEKKDKVRELLHNKLIVFTLTARPEFLYVEILKIEDDIVPAKEYGIIPGPELRLDENKEDFEKKLVDKGRPFTLRMYPHIFEQPEFLFYEGTIYSVYLNTSPNPTTYTQDVSFNVTYKELNDKFYNMVDATIDSHIYFIDISKIMELRDLMHESDSSLSEKVVEAVLKLDEIAATELAEPIGIKKRPMSSSSSIKMTYKHNKEEIEFIKRLEENAKIKGLFYKQLDLSSFHISMKTNLLTIIGGMSGTGKSQLAQLYGETMGLEFGKNLVMIPVSPSYHEPNDILGYLNPTTGVYHESETGLVKLLLEAEQYPERMYMVIFDEMNLSQVEHWFSPFISLLELDEDKRFLSLFNENSHCINGKYKPKIKIGNNVIFVGTVNFDETTKSFSDRLLDRSNVISPNKMSFAESLAYDHGEKGKLETLDVYTTIYRKWATKDTQKGLKNLTVEEIHLLDELHNLLSSSDIQKGVSFRVALGIADFLTNIPATETGTLVIDRRDAFDLQLKQRVLTKINGIESYIEPLVGSQIDGDYNEGSITMLLKSEVGQKVSDFDQSIDTLKNKAKELMIYGFVN